MQICRNLGLYLKILSCLAITVREYETLPARAYQHHAFHPEYDFGGREFNSLYVNNNCEAFSNGSVQIMSIAKFDKTPIAQAMTHELELIQVHFRSDELWLSFSPNSRNIIHPFWAHFRERFNNFIVENNSRSGRPYYATAGSYYDPAHGRIIVVPGLQTALFQTTVGIHFIVGREGELFPGKPEETVLGPLKENEDKIVLMNFADIVEQQNRSKTVFYSLRTIITDEESSNQTSKNKKRRRLQISNVELHDGILTEHNTRQICINLSQNVIFTYDNNVTNIPNTCKSDINIDLAYIYQSRTYLLSYSSYMVLIINQLWLNNHTDKTKFKAVKLNDFLRCKSLQMAALSTFLPVAIMVMIVLFCCCVCCSFISEHQERAIVIN